MRDAKKITSWLESPGSMNESEQATCKSINQQYPYFTPTQYISLFNTSNRNSIHVNNQWMFEDYINQTTPIRKEVTEQLVDTTDTEVENEDNENIIPPLYTEDYFLHEGVNVSSEIPEELSLNTEQKAEEDEKSLMVVMSFSDWLAYYKKKKQKEQEEEEDQRAVKSLWQRQKLAAAIEEENDEIPEDVFEMAVNSISKEEGLVSEALAQVHVKQGRYDKAIEMYKKLSLLNPQKKAYFARKIEEILKEK